MKQMNAGLATVADCAVPSGFRNVRIIASEEGIHPLVNLVNWVHLSWIESAFKRMEKSTLLPVLFRTVRMDPAPTLLHSFFLFFLKFYFDFYSFAH